MKLSKTQKAAIKKLESAKAELYKQADALRTVKEKIVLTTEQLESLNQYANHCKMHPSDKRAGDNWRNVPVSQGQFDRLSSINQDWFVEVANNF